MKFHFLPLMMGMLLTPVPLLIQPNSAIAAQSSLTYRQVSQDVASEQLIDLSVAPGWISTIDFTQTSEIIIYVGLGDRSRLVFEPNTPLESGTTKTLFLKPIQRIHFPGELTTQRTNLVVQTIHPQTRIQRTYHFRIQHLQHSPQILGIQVIPPTPNLTLDLGQERIGTLENVELGLQLALNRGYTAPDDPIVAKVKAFLAIARQSKTSLINAAQQSGISMAVIVELARIHYESISSL